MNFTEIKTRATDTAIKVISILYVAGLKATDGARYVWANRRECAPKIIRYSIVFLAGTLLALLLIRGKTDPSAGYTEPEPVVTTTAAPAIVVSEPTAEELAEAAAAQEAAIQQAAVLREAQAMAKVLYGTARYHSEEAQAAVCWLIINRAESSLFPNSIEEVCSQDKQWVGYSADNPITQDLYRVALDVVEAWNNDGIRMFSRDFLYLSWSDSEIILRTSFNENKNTRYWHVS